MVLGVDEALLLSDPMDRNALIFLLEPGVGSSWISVVNGVGGDEFDLPLLFNRIEEVPLTQGILLGSLAML